MLILSAEETKVYRDALLHLQSIFPHLIIKQNTATKPKQHFLDFFPCFLISFVSIRSFASITIVFIMHGKLASVALVGLSAVASARPMMAATTGTMTMNSTKPHSTGTASSGAFSFPLHNGFPNIQVPSSQLSKIEKQAGGTLPGPNGAPPTGLGADTVNSQGFVAFNELFEVAFFTELLRNVSAGGAGFDQIENREMVLANLKVIHAQEELHELNANAIFKANTGKTIEPCKYQFPVDTFTDAIALASKFTDVVLSTLPDIQQIAAVDTDVAVVGAVGSVIGQEGEQNGFYRSILGKVPSQLPFLTGGARNFAFNAILQNFVVPGSCPSLGLLEQPASGIPLNETGILNVLSDLSLTDVTAHFSVQTVETSNTHNYYQTTHGSKMNFVTYINQKNAPVSVPINQRSITFDGDAIHFTASFPGATDDLNGLTIAAVTETNAFTSPDEVASATQFGPGLIEIN